METSSTGTPADAPPAAGYDIVTVGRAGVDIYPLQIGVGLEDVRTFGKFLGGTAANVAVAAARHGLRAALVSRTGDDPFGRFVHAALRELGVDDRFVTPVGDLPTPVTFCEIFPPDDFPLYFQVSRQIEAAIDSGVLAPGDRLENEISLADRWGLSRPTMRRAIQELVDKGLLVRRRGIGTQDRKSVV